MIHTDENKQKKAAQSRLLSSVTILLVLASIPSSTMARYGTCGRSYRYGYPRRRYYNTHRWNDWGGSWDHRSSCGNRSCRRHYYYNPFVELFGDLLDAGMNSLARQERRRSDTSSDARLTTLVEEATLETSPRYRLEDLGRSGFELAVEMPGFEAHEIDLEINPSSEDGTHTLSVRGSPGVHRRRSVKTPKVSQSFLINDDTIDVDGISARLSPSGILTITMPRKERKRRRVPPSAIKSWNNNKSNDEGDEILVFDAKRREFYGSDKRAAKRRKKNASNPKKKAELPIKKVEPEIEEDQDDGDDDGLWISEAEDIW